jgi:uncharacterized protein with FMN-binding domain
MKQILLLIALVFAAVAAAAGIAGCATASFSGVSGRLARFNAGIWAGSGEGYSGPILVEVETGENQILRIRLVEENEDPLSGGEAIRELVSLVLEYDNTDIDAISGATVTSEGFLHALDDALNKAALNKAALNKAALGAAKR